MTATTANPTFFELLTLYCDGETTAAQDIDVCRLVSRDDGWAERLRWQKCWHEHLRRSLIRCYGEFGAPCALAEQVTRIFDSHSGAAAEERSG
ncbi:MAG: hypothetical protein L0Y44_15475 [Phycisphaerales bacterium]|nr:hypothetical protein [Phycisphaerales bacterium]